MLVSKSSIKSFIKCPLLHWKKKNINAKILSRHERTKGLQTPFEWCAVVSNLDSPPNIYYICFQGTYVKILWAYMGQTMIYTIFGSLSKSRRIFGVTRMTHCELISWIIQRGRVRQMFTHVSAWYTLHSVLLEFYSNAIKGNSLCVAPTSWLAKWLCLQRPCISYKQFIKVFDQRRWSILEVNEETITSSFLLFFITKVHCHLQFLLYHFSFSFVPLPHSEPPQLWRGQYW